jgi:hypothetical protein
LANASLEKAEFPLKKGQLHSNPEFSHVYKAMRIATKELEDAIFTNKHVYFDAAPIDYEELENKNTRWVLLSQSVFSKKRGIE